MFILERNADTFNLVAPNLDMAGATVASMMFYNRNDDMNYFFQFEVDDLIYPTLNHNRSNDPMLTMSEFANLVGVHIDLALESYRNFGQEVVFSGVGEVAANAEEIIANNNNMIRRSIDAPTIHEPSQEGLEFDRLIELTQSDPMDLQTLSGTRGLLPNIPDSLYNNNPGWSDDFFDYTLNGGLAIGIGYVVYQKNASMTGNILNSVVRYESRLEYSVVLHKQISNQSIVIIGLIRSNTAILANYA